MREPSNLWKRGRTAAIEVVVIAVGILLALAADAWWDGRQRLERESALVRALHAEFEGHLGELEETATAHAGILSRALALLEAGRSGSSSSAGMDLSLGVLLNDRRTDLNSGVLQGYLTMADPSLLTSPELRTALAQWPAQLDELWQQERRTRALVDEHLAPFLNQRGDLVALLPRDFSPEEDRLAQLRTSAEEERRNELLLRDPQLLNLIAQKVFLEREVLRKHVPVREAHGRLIQMLASEVERLAGR